MNKISNAFHMTNVICLKEFVKTLKYSILKYMCFNILELKYRSIVLSKKASK